MNRSTIALFTALLIPSTLSQAADNTVHMVYPPALDAYRLNGEVSLKMNCQTRIATSYADSSGGTLFRYVVTHFPAYCENYNGNLSVNNRFTWPDKVEQSVTTF